LSQPSTRRGLGATFEANIGGPAWMAGTSPAMTIRGSPPCALCSPSVEYQRVAMQIRRTSLLPKNVVQKFGRSEDINHLSEAETSISKLFQIFIWTGYETSMKYQKVKPEKFGIARF
jgi:hypothetical protein